MKKVSDLPSMNDENLAEFWDNNDPENFEGWQETGVKFNRLPKKLIQLRLDPRDVRIIDRIIKSLSLIFFSIEDDLNLRKNIIQA